MIEWPRSAEIQDGGDEDVLRVHDHQIGGHDRDPAQSGEFFLSPKVVCDRFPGFAFSHSDNCGGEKIMRGYN